ATGGEVEIRVADQPIDIEGLGRTPTGVEGAGDGLAEGQRAVVADPGLVLTIADAGADDQLIRDLDVQTHRQALRGEAAVALAGRILTSPVHRTGGPQANRGASVIRGLRRRVQAIVACGCRGCELHSASPEVQAQHVTLAIVAQGVGIETAIQSQLTAKSLSR